jgi:hypothetical protein
MADDYRKKYVLTTASNYFSRQPDEFLKYSNEKHLSKFLDDLNTILLVVNVARDISFSNKVNYPTINKNKININFLSNIFSSIFPLQMTLNH